MNCILTHRRNCCKNIICNLSHFVTDSIFNFVTAVVSRKRELGFEDSFNACRQVENSLFCSQYGGILNLNLPASKRKVI